MELVDNGQSIRQEAFGTVLQSAGGAEIVSNTILFKAADNGARMAKVFTIDATTYPKGINVSSLDRPEGTGIYRFEGQRLVICFSDPAVTERPTEFSSRPGSRHMLMIMERSHDNENLVAGSAASAAAPLSGSRTPSVTMPAPAPDAIQIAAPAPVAKVIQVRPPASEPRVVEVEVARPEPEVIRVQLPAQPAMPLPPTAATARVLTDAEVTTMLRGSWRLNDGIGVLQMHLDPNGTYRSYREVQDPSTFYKVFVNAPVAAGSWSVQNGKLEFQITSSTDPKRVGQILHAVVRSISATDVIFVDPWGRVVKAIRM